MTTNAERPRKIGPFRLDDQLGIGGMGVVYSATYEPNGLRCAVKVLVPDLSANDAVNQRFIRETEILKKLRHPNIIKYYGAGANRSQRFYAMEIVDGGSLEQVIRKAGHLPWDQAIDYAIQIARALEHAHNAGIVHRDLKPANLLLARDGTLKLSDFGIARDTQATALTQAGKTVGTMNYMAPEQISGKYPVTRHTDLYALGCVIFEMLTGRVPFQSDTQAELLFKHLEEMPPSVLDFNQGVPVALSVYVNGLLAKEPSDRPYDALAVQTSLEELKVKLAKQAEKHKQQETVSGATVAADRVTQVQKKKKTRKKNREPLKPVVPIYERPSVLGAVLVIVLMGTIFAVVRMRSESHLYGQVSPIMAETDPAKWYHAETQLRTMLGRYPSGQHSSQVRDWIDQIDMHRTETRVKRDMEKAGYNPKNEAEALYIAAESYERIGDRLTALERFDAIPSVIPMSEENRPYLNLASNKASRIRGTLTGNEDRATFVKGILNEADELFTEGKELLAREKWHAIIKLYGNSPEFESFTSQAQQNLVRTARN